MNDSFNYHDNYIVAARKIIAHVGKNVVMGVPLGLGKPVGLLNALYQIACEDKSIQLTIVTGLTLARPTLTHELEKRFVEPFLDRILKDYEDPLYEHARVLEQLPSNIHVLEFFLSPGKFLHNSYAQQNYVSSKYTSAARDSLYYSINVLAQMITHSATDKAQYSLSCNADLFHDVERRLLSLRDKGEKIAIVGEVNLNLPFMYGDALVSADNFTDIIDTSHYKALFAMPREALSIQDHLIGLYASSLIRDDGCLQIGIGKLGNAIANALVLRHKDNKLYQDLLKQLSVTEKFGKTIKAVGMLSTFEKGLYASTEMVSDEYMALYKAGILKKRVYDHIGLQQLLNSGEISEKVTPDTIDVLLKHAIIQPILTEADVLFLAKFGIFKADIRYLNNELILTTGEHIAADLSNKTAKKMIIERCLADHLATGKLIHAAFFLGSVDFYRQLNELPLAIRQQISMSPVARTNCLSWSPDLLKLQRKDGRFVNTAMMIKLGGGVVSDGLANLDEVSGVGGQFDFVIMAHELDDARSIMNCRSTRKTKEGVQSNIVWDYPNSTLPRYLRDIVVTEYGIADCRSKTDAEIIKSLLHITDSRFQQNLLATAKRYRKVAADYVIPETYQHNFPHVIEAIARDLQFKNHFKTYPFGCDFTDEEIVLERALLLLKNASQLTLAGWIAKSLFCSNKNSKFENYLLRMQLNHPSTLKEWVYKRLLIAALRHFN